MFPILEVIRTRSLCEFGFIDAPALSLIFCASVQLGTQRGSTFHYCPPRHEPCRPSIQSRHLRTCFQIPEQFSTPLSTPFNPSNRVILFQSTRPIVRNTKPPTITWFSLQDAPRLRTPLNVCAVFLILPLEMLSIPPLPSSLPTDWI